MNYSWLPITRCLSTFIYTFGDAYTILSCLGEFNQVFSSLAEIKKFIEKSDFERGENGRGVKKSIRAASIQRDGSSIDDNCAQQSNRKRVPSVSFFLRPRIFHPPGIFAAFLPRHWFPFLLPIRCSSGDCIVTPFDRRRPGADISQRGGELS